MDYRKLRGIIVTKYGTATAFAKEIGIEPSQMSKYLTGKSNWSHALMAKVIEKLEIPLDMVGEIFFAG